MTNELKYELMRASLQHSKDEWYKGNPQFSNVAQRAFTHGAEWLEKQQASAESDCSSLERYLEKLLNNVMKMKVEGFKSDSDEKYISGQELICSLIIQEIARLKSLSS